jgi:hypothetical protein
MLVVRVYKKLVSVFNAFSICINPESSIQNPESRIQNPASSFYKPRHLLMFLMILGWVHFIEFQKFFGQM